MTREELEFEIKMQARDYINEKLPQVPEIDPQALEDLFIAVNRFKSSLDKVNKKIIKTEDALNSKNISLPSFDYDLDMQQEDVKI